VLLTRTYENESVAELKKMARERGLSPKGNKSTLITRIQGHEQHKSLQAVSSVQDPPSRQVRRASPTSSGSEASSPVPGMPQAAEHSNNMASTTFTNVNLPDLSLPDTELPTPIPFYPDFYDSIHHPTPYKTGDHSTEPSIPKVLVVSSAHLDVGPLHEQGLSSRSRFSTPGGSILQDVADDIGMPTTWKRGLTGGSQTVSGLLKTKEASSTGDNDYSRRLDGEEVRGVWMLLGLLTGSWVLGGVINRTPKEKHIGEHHS